MRQFLAEAVHALRANTTFDECAGIHTGAGVTLEEDLIAAAWVILTAEEVIEANFVQRSRRRVRRNVTANADARTLSAVTDLPDPDSPTRPSTRPGSTVSVTSSTMSLPVAATFSRRLVIESPLLTLASTIDSCRHARHSISDETRSDGE